MTAPAVKKMIPGIIAPHHVPMFLHEEDARTCWMHCDAVHAMSPQLGQGANMALLDAWILAKCLQDDTNLDLALGRYHSLRASHVGIYQLISRWLTPLFQSHSRAGSLLRDWTFYPASRLPLARTSMLRTLSGLQEGYFGEYRGIDV